MASFYALGVVKKFTAKSNQILSEAEWKKQLNERLDTEQYTVNFMDNIVKGELKQGVFKNNIEDFYNKLFQITNDKRVSLYFEDSGTVVEQYQYWNTGMTISEYDPNIFLSADLAVLFIEGKVLVEEFNIEPKLINWLFRHVDLSNPLGGCIITDIVS